MPVHFVMSLVLALATWSHEYYVGVFKMDYIPAEQRIELTAKLFTDDFEQALSQFAGHPITLNNPEKHGALIARYCLQNIQLGANQGPLKLQFVGAEATPDVTYVYLECTQVASYQEINVTVRMFFEILPKQINIFHLRHAGKTTSAYLNTSNPQFLFKL